MIHTATKILHFDYGHRVLGHKGKCVNLHGHHGIVQITASAPTDLMGMVIDFSILKERFGEWIDRNWDHNMILHPEDPCIQSIPWMQLQDKKPFELRIAKQALNPTAENLAGFLMQLSNSLFAFEIADRNLKFISIKFWETPSCCAEVRTHE